MRLREIQYGQVVRITSSRFRGAIVVGIETQSVHRPWWVPTRYDGEVVPSDIESDGKILGIALHCPGEHPGYVFISRPEFRDLECTPVNFQFDGLTEPAPQPQAGPPQSDEARVAALGLSSHQSACVWQSLRAAAEHPDPRVPHVARAYYFEGRTVEFRPVPGSAWRSTWERSRFGGAANFNNLSYFPDYEYRIAGDNDA